MKLSYKARRIGSLLMLVVGLPVYIVLALNFVDLLGDMPKLVELILFIMLGFAWALPFRWLFLGVGKADPDAPQEAPKDQDKNRG